MATEGDLLVAKIRKLVPGTRAHHYAMEDLASYLLQVLPDMLPEFAKWLPIETPGDLASIAAASIMANLGQFNGTSSFETWARQVGRNACIGVLRKALAKRRPKLTALVDEDGNDIIDPPDPGPAPSDRLRDKQDEEQLIQLIKRAIAKLDNKRAKELLRLSILDGMDIKGILAYYGIPLSNRNATESALSKAKKSLIEVLKDLKVERVYKGQRCLLGGIGSQGKQLRKARK